MLRLTDPTSIDAAVEKGSYHSHMSDAELLTPAKASNPFEELNPKGSRKRKQIDFTCTEIADSIESQQASASPSFKKVKDMPACRSPTLLRKATLLAGNKDPPMDTDLPRPAVPVENGRLEAPAAATSQGATTAMIDPSFLANLDKKLDLLTSGMMSISSRVDEQAKKQSDNSAAIAAQGEAITNNSRDIADIFKKLERLQKGQSAPAVPQERATCSQQYRWARRSVRIWPVRSGTEDELWESTGDFLHDKLKLTGEQVCQEDIESIKKVEGSAAMGTVRDEVLVTFFSPEVRDSVMMNAKNLAGDVDAAGIPMAGVRLEIPPELLDTFRLLSRFGTRLRARHGEGTKRHIKFDDFNAGLFAVIKLPGDTGWTRVSPAMARRDLEASFLEEERATQKRLAVKLLPGPRERLHRPPEPANGGRRMLAPPGDPSHGLGSSGLRPRSKWRVPDRPPA